MPTAKILPAAFIATTPSTKVQRRVALAVVLVSFLCFALMAPFVRIPLGPVPAFIPAYESALAINEALTSILLFGLFMRLRTPALLAMAGGYLYNTLAIIAHALTFPGAFAPSGLLGSGAQTTAWLYVFWHGGFPLFVLAYARLSGASVGLIQRPMRAALGAVVGTALLVLCAVLISTLGHDLLPVIVVDGDYSRLVSYGISPAVLALTVLALAALWRRRSGTVLDLWLMVVLCTWLCDVGLSAVIGSARYDLGWYGGRTFGLVAASFVLGALLVEMNNLYGKLAEAVTEAEAQNLALATSRAQLVQVQRLEAIGRLTGGIAHDFNNLLTAIVGGLDMIIRRPEDTERVARLAKNAMTAAERSAQLINQLLTFARKQSLRPEVLNPNTILTEFQMLARRAVGDAIEVRQNFDPALHLVRIDAAEFQSAILNLITNARDAMPSGGTLTIATRNVEIDERLARQIPELVPGHYAVVTVADTGTGMDSAVQAQVFEPFFTTKPVGKGTGLGLSQVYGFAQSAGGHAVIASKLGVGTSVELYLPRSGGRAVSQVAASDFPLRQARPGETVLLVEDDVDVMRATAESLNELGYKVLTAPNGAEGLRALTDQQRIDILFSDVVMPGGMNGVQLAVEARRVRPHLKVLLTSGYTGAALQAHGVPEDLQLLAKPYRREELAQKLRLVLGDAGQKDG